MTLLRRLSLKPIMPYITAILVMVVAATIISLTNPRISDMKLSGDRARGLVNAAFVIDYMPGRPAIYHMESAIGCISNIITVNGSRLSVPIFDCAKGDVDLSSFLQKGENKVGIELRSSFPPSSNGLSFFTLEPYYFGNSGASTLATMALILAALYIPGRWLWASSKDGAMVLLYIMGALASLAFLYLSPNILWTNDFYDHARYIAAAAENWPVGALDYSGRESWHPPLYYILMGLVLKVSGKIGVISPDATLHFVAFFTYLLFIVYGLRTCKRWLSGPYFLMAGAMVVFWPSALLRSLTINNDVLLNTVSAAFLYYISCWWQEGTRRAFVKAALCVCIGLMIKTSALTLVYVLLVVMALRWFLAKRLHPEWLIAFALIAVGMAGNLARPLYHVLLEKPQPFQMHLGEQSSFSPTPERLFSVGVSNILRNPMPDIPKDTVPEFLVKTAVFSEWGSWTRNTLTPLLPICFALLGLTCLIHLLMQDAHRLIHRAPIAAAFFAYVLAIYGFYLLKQWLVCADFRFIYPVLIPFSILCADVCQGAILRKRILGAAAALYLTLGFIVLSCWQYGNHLVTMAANKGF